MSEMHELGVVESAEMIRSGALSAVELMEGLLARCAALEDALRVWVTLDGDAALAAARERDRELAAEGSRGPLHGVPVGIKDIYFTRGVLTTSGSTIYAEFRTGLRRDYGGAAEAGGRDNHGQDGYYGVRMRRPVADRQPVECGAYSGRLKQRVGCGRGGRDVSGSTWVANRRLDRASVFIQRYSGAQADIWAGEPIWRVPGVGIIGHDGAYDAQRCGRGIDAERPWPGMTSTTLTRRSAPRRTICRRLNHRGSRRALGWCRSSSWSSAMTRRAIIHPRWSRSCARRALSWKRCRCLRTSTMCCWRSAR